MRRHRRGHYQHAGMDEGTVHTPAWTMVSTIHAVARTRKCNINEFQMVASGLCLAALFSGFFFNNGYYINMHRHIFESLLPTHRPGREWVLSAQWREDASFLSEPTYLLTTTTHEPAWTRMGSIHELACVRVRTIHALAWTRLHILFAYLYTGLDDSGYYPCVGVDASAHNPCIGPDKSTYRRCVLLRFIHIPGTHFSLILFAPAYAQPPTPSSWCFAPRESLYVLLMRAPR